MVKLFPDIYAKPAYIEKNSTFPLGHLLLLQ